MFLVPFRITKLAPGIRQRLMAISLVTINCFVSNLVTKDREAYQLVINFIRLIYPNRAAKLHQLFCTTNTVVNKAVCRTKLDFD